MIILDTCALIYDALHPEKLSKKARSAIQQAEEQSCVSCCDISLWEIAMLIQKNRLNPSIDTHSFLTLMLSARSIRVLEINISIAALSTQALFKHHDPADRLIASTALHYHAPLITCDRQLSAIPDLDIIW
ncbi:MAG: type II toxin-antitoxin system VapC family toxin [Legionellaceae bacterium]|nr:type II toxin-antitoxin system VapC family toxin [Legionellaceae bacterium]